MPELKIGKKANGQEFALQLNTLQRHFACFGASGSGKTVACKVMLEELVRAGVPVIAFDPQGDIASLACPASEEDVVAKGVDPELLHQYQQKAEVVIWTPASSKGLPLSINPLRFDGVELLPDEDQLRYFADTAKNLAGLVGYDTESDDGKAVESVLTGLFEYNCSNNTHVTNFTELIKQLENLPDDVNAVVQSILSNKLLKDMVKKFTFLTMGARRLLFDTGIPADIDTLLGLDQPDNGKTRISVIYLNTLSTQQEKEFFIGAITQQLYRWMLSHPLTKGQDGLQCAYYIDEIAPYLPPVRKPACKESLMLVFKQARKYGVGCLVATQNPGDIDYKSVAQVQTYFLGRLTTAQDIKKVRTRLDSVAPAQADTIVQDLPALTQGKFMVLAPDEFDEPQTVNIRWLLTKHDVLTEEVLANYNPPEVVAYYMQGPQAGQELDGTEQAVDNFEETGEESPDHNYYEQDEHEDANNPILNTIPDEDAVLVAKNSIYEQDLPKLLRPLLDGGLFTAKEKLIERTFAWLPLLKAEVVLQQKKGFFSKKTVEIPENLYLDYSTHKILYLDKRNKFVRFDPELQTKAKAIEDLDDGVVVEQVAKSELDIDLGKLKPPKTDTITRLLQRRWPLQVKNIELVLLPTWNCLLAHKNGKQRSVLIDAATGYQIELPK